MGNTLSAKVLAVGTVVAYALSFLIGRDSVIGSALSVLGLLLLLFTIIAAVREYRQRKAAPRA